MRSKWRSGRFRYRETGKRRERVPERPRDTSKVAPGGIQPVWKKGEGVRVYQTASSILNWNDCSSSDVGVEDVAPDTDTPPHTSSRVACAVAPPRTRRPGPASLSVECSPNVRPTSRGGRAVQRALRECRKVTRTRRGARPPPLPPTQELLCREVPARLSKARAASPDTDTERADEQRPALDTPTWPRCGYG